MNATYMNTLHSQLVDSYREHPAFRLGVEPFGLDDASIRAFNDAYEALAPFASRMSAKRFEAARASCHAALTAVFRQLEAGCADDHERRFLAELGEQVRRLFDEEALFHRRSGGVRGIGFSADESLAGAVALCRERHFFGRMSEDATASINLIAAPNIERFRAAAAEGRNKRDDLSLTMGNDIRAIIGLLDDDFARSGVLDALAAYSGQRVTVSGLALELSVPTSRWWENSFVDLPRPPETLYAHLDEAIANPKAIVYLTDVTREHGPTSCYPHAFDDLALSPLQALVGRVISNVGSGANSPLKAYYAKRYHQSVNSENFRRHFMRLPPGLRFNSHFGWDLMPGSAAERTLAARERFMIGGAGTYIVFDGARLLHRGGMPQAGERVALQVVFGPTSLLRRVARRVRGALR
jgi:hypothetical protein